MVGASKILTVSYGTFSCTLEGFEEPFGTMKAIAEYFRDLAADDRYFGAEPPIPDAAMLHRIAEREIHRRVEAKIQDNSVILRAGDIAATTPRPAPADASPPEPRPTPRGPTGLVADESVAARLSRIRNAAATQVGPTLRLVEDAVFTEDQHADAPAARAASATPEPVAPAPVAAAPVTPAPATPEPVSVAPVTAAPVAPAPATPAPVAPAPAASLDTAPDLPAAALAAVAAVDMEEATEPSQPAAVPQELPQSVAAEPEAPACDEPALADPEDALVGAAAGAGPQEPALTAMAEPADEPADEDDEAEPLLLERATDDEVGTVLILSASVAAQAETVDAAETAVPDIRAFMDSLLGDGPSDAVDLLPEHLSALPDAAFDDLLPELVDEANDEAEAALLAALADPVAELDDAASSQPDTYIGALIATLAGNDTADVLPAKAASEPADDQSAEDWGTEADPATLDTTPEAEGAIATLWPADPADPAPIDRDETDKNPSGPATPIADRLRRARARVIKVRRPDLPTTPPSEVPSATALSAEAEAELLRELAEVERETAAHHRDGLTVLEATSSTDDAVNRLLRQTNSEMDGLDTRRRVSTIAHLKAAVAATVADQKVPQGTAATEPSRLDTYRADLARVVRPRRPGDAPSADRPMPLVLVSEQRVDRPKPLQLTPQIQPDSTGARVLPRRVTSSNLAVETLHDDDDADDLSDTAPTAPQGSSSFAEFAEKLGATELSDLLEAAAAYTVCVEGRPYFSRPQVMRHVADISDDDLSREDGLRSFGQLLRQGKIAKVKRGQFEITPASHYLTEARRMSN